MSFLLDTDICSAYIKRPSGLIHRVPTRLDLLIAATAICHQLILVTHNTADYVNIPGIQLDDWPPP